jgi:hypothetical protein
MFLIFPQKTSLFGRSELVNVVITDVGVAYLTERNTASGNLLVLWSAVVGSEVSKLLAAN